MRHPEDKRAARVNRLQNITITLLTFSMAFLVASLPLFGALSDRSLLELARDALRRQPDATEQIAAAAPTLSFPVRMVYTNSFARLGSDALTTLSDEFELAGTYLGEAVGSAGDREAVGEIAFLAALRGEGLYCDFTTALPPDILSDLLGVSVPEGAFTGARRLLLIPGENDSAMLYLQEGDGKNYLFSTAVSGSALTEFLASRSGNSTDFAFLLGSAYADLSPYTLILSDPLPRGMLEISNALSAKENEFLRRAEFNAHSENRFTESTGMTIVREVSGSLSIWPDGTVEYQGLPASPDSIYYVPAAEPGMPTLPEAASAAQMLVSTLLQDMLGDAWVYLDDVQGENGRYEISFDLMANGTPIRFSDGSHAVTVTIDAQSVTAFTAHMRHYAITEEVTPLLPLAQAAAIARVWGGAELVAAYIDAGGDTATVSWVAE